MSEIKLLPSVDLNEWLKSYKPRRTKTDPSTWLIEDYMLKPAATAEGVPTNSVNNNATDEPGLKPTPTKGQGKRKLTEDGVRDIRARAENGEKNSVIAKDYGVTQTCIYNIVKGKTWKHVK